MFVERIRSKEGLAGLLGKVSVDHDGIISDTRKLVTDEFNLRFKTSHTPDEIRDWNTVVGWGLGAGLSLDEAKAQNDDLWYNGDLLKKADLVPGAYEFMYEAYKLGVQIPINSSRRPELYESTVEWYASRMSFVIPEQIHVGLRDIPDGELSKLWMIKIEGKSIHIEDSYSQVKIILDNSDIFVILLANKKFFVDSNHQGRFTQITGKDGQMPTMKQVYDLFFSKSHVAQS